MKNKEPRLVCLDVIRCIAILAVVLCHAVVGDTYNFTVDFMNSIGFLSKIFAFTVFVLSRLGVPLFLLLSGYLLLDKFYDDEACKKFWKNKWLGLLIAVEIWTIIYNIFWTAWNSGKFSFVFLGSEMLFLKESPMHHMWYIPMILGMYLTLPFISNALTTINTKVLRIPYIIILFCFMGIPTANMICHIVGFGIGNTLLSFGFGGGAYGLYIITGYLLKKGVFKSFSAPILGGVCVFSFCAITILQLLSFHKNIDYTVWYDNFFLLVCSVCLFELISRGKNFPWPTFFTVISKYSFGIFLIHYPINLILKKYLSVIKMRPLLVLAVWIGTFIISLALSIIISKIPKVGKKMLYLR